MGYILVGFGQKANYIHVEQLHLRSTVSEMKSGMILIPLFCKENMKISFKLELLSIEFLQFHHKPSPFCSLYNHVAKDPDFWNTLGELQLTLTFSFMTSHSFGCIEGRGQQ